MNLYELDKIIEQTIKDCDNTIARNMRQKQRLERMRRAIQNAAVTGPKGPLKIAER